MRVKTLALSDLRAFSGRHITELEPRLTTLVGPNNVGKTTVFRALQLAAGTVEYAESADAPAYGSQGLPWVEVGLVPCSDDETLAVASQAGLVPLDSAAIPAGSSSMAIGQTTTGSRSLASGVRVDAREFRLLWTAADNRWSISGLDPNGATFPGPSAHIDKWQVSKLLFKTAYAGDLPALAEVFDPNHMDPHYHKTTERLLRLAGGLPASFQRTPAQVMLDRFSDRVNRELEAAVEEIGFAGLVSDLRFGVDQVDGGRITITLCCERGTRIRPRDLGAGPNWLVAFALWCATEVQPETTLLLLDEPAVHLDPRNQRRLREYLWRLSERRQIVYSTHSPFMIDRRHLERLVMVEFRNGTSALRKRPRGANLDELRTALGIVGGDSFLFGAANLVVEGLSDRVYVDRFAESMGLLDPDFVNVVAAGKNGGTGEVDSTVRLLKELGTPVAVLLDNDRAGREAAKLLLNRKRLPENHVVLPNGDAEVPEMAIEDHLDLNVLLRCVNDVHGLRGNGALSREALCEFRLTEKFREDGPCLQALSIARGISQWLKKQHAKEFDKVKVAIVYCEALDRGEVEPPAAIISALKHVDRVLTEAVGP